MTKEQAAKLGPGDELMVTTSDGIGDYSAGTVFTILGVDSDGDIILPGNVFLFDHRRVDLYRKAKVAKKMPAIK